MTFAAPFETVFLEGHESARRIADIGLDADGLLQVVGEGEAARAQVTRHHPASWRGIQAYGERVRSLRDRFVGKGWEVQRQDGLELLVRSDHQTAVITRAGDAGVGLRSAMPQPVSFVGDATADATAAQLALDPNWLNLPRVDTTGIVVVYMLLVFRARNVARAELSLPSAISEGRVDGWIERLALPEINFDEPGTSRRTGPRPEIDVPVTRKRR